MLTFFCIVLIATIPKSLAGWESPKQISNDCAPCASSARGASDYRGNGADNLGYDWSPKAWGGPAFPARKASSGDDAWKDRGGRMMATFQAKPCQGCQDNEKGWPAAEADMSATVTSPVLGIRHRDDKRLPVEWSGRSMRWDGFRNGMPWMERRDGSDIPGRSSWDTEGRGHYAADWNYDDNSGRHDAAWRDEQRWSSSKWQSNERGYGSGGSDRPPFGSSYPSSPSPYPSDPWSSNGPQPSMKPFYVYPSSRPPPNYNPSTPRPNYSSGHQPPASSSYGGSSWSQPEIYLHKPNDNYLPGPSSPRPPSYTTRNPYEGTPGTAIWNAPTSSRPNRPGYYTGFITEISDPNQNPTNRPSYGWQNRPDRDQGYGRPSSNDRYPARPNNDRYPNRPSAEEGYPHRPSEDRYPTRPNQEYPYRPDDRNPYGPQNPNSGYDKPDYNKYGPNSYNYPSKGPSSTAHDRDRYPSYNKGDRWNYDGSDRNQNQLPGYGNDRDRRPSYGSDRDWNSQHNSDRDRYNYNYNSGTNQDRYPQTQYGDGGNRYPGGNDRYPPPGYAENDRPPSRPTSGDYDRPSSSSDSANWNYGDEGKEVPYRRSGGSYPPYKGGQYYTSAYLASASTPASSIQGLDKSETTEAPNEG